jgi:hypothetical protein
VKRIKIKGNQYAELVGYEGVCTGTVMHTRLENTNHGDLFLNLLSRAMERGVGLLSPPELVNYCYETTRLAYAKLASDGMLAIQSPPQSAIDRKLDPSKKGRADD